MSGDSGSNLISFNYTSVAYECIYVYGRESVMIRESVAATSEEEQNKCCKAVSDRICDSELCAVIVRKKQDRVGIMKVQQMQAFGISAKQKKERVRSETSKEQSERHKGKKARKRQESAALDLVHVAPNFPAHPIRGRTFLSYFISKCDYSCGSCRAVECLV